MAKAKVKANTSARLKQRQHQRQRQFQPSHQREVIDATTHARPAQVRGARAHPGDTPPPRTSSVAVADTIDALGVSACAEYEFEGDESDNPTDYDAHSLTCDSHKCWLAREAERKKTTAANHLLNELVNMQKAALESINRKRARHHELEAEIEKFKIKKLRVENLKNHVEFQKMQIEDILSTAVHRYNLLEEERIRILSTTVPRAIHDAAKQDLADLERIVNAQVTPTDPRRRMSY